MLLAGLVLGLLMYFMGISVTLNINDVIIFQIGFTKAERANGY
jgi:hypothetical protein